MPLQSCVFSVQEQIRPRLFSESSTQIALSKIQFCQNVCFPSPLKNHVPVYNHATGRMWICFSMQLIRDLLLLSWPLLLTAKTRSLSSPLAYLVQEQDTITKSLQHYMHQRIKWYLGLAALTDITRKGVDPKRRNCCRDILVDFSALGKPTYFKANFFP